MEINKKLDGLIMTLQQHTPELGLTNASASSNRVDGLGLGNGAQFCSDAKFSTGGQISNEGSDSEFGLSWNNVEDSHVLPLWQASGQIAEATGGHW